MTIVRSTLCLALLVAGCGGASKPQTMPASEAGSDPAPAPTETEAPTTGAAPAGDSAPDAKAAPATEAVPAAAPPAPPPKTRGPVPKGGSKTSDPCDGGE